MLVSDGACICLGSVAYQLAHVPYGLSWMASRVGRRRGGGRGVRGTGDGGASARVLLPYSAAGPSAF